jgi:putative two-component system response regulator
MRCISQVREITINRMLNVTEENLKRFMDVLNSKDPYTRRHSERVGALMEQFADAIPLPSSQIRQMRIAGLMHDAGKLDISDGILEKIAEGKSLTPDDKKEMELHVVSENQIARFGDPPVTVLQAIRHHHENWDGSGFPDGLDGADIPPAARMLTICDLYASITAERPAQKAMSWRKAVGLLRKSSSVKLDPKLTDIFIERVISTEKPPSIKEKLLQLLKKRSNPGSFSIF